jgi:hypothetical protein
MLSFWTIQDIESFLIEHSLGLVHVGKKHFFMTPFISAPKDDHSWIVHFSTHSEEAAWTSNIWIRPLLVLIVDILMIKLSNFIVSLLRFAKPEMCGQFIGAGLLMSASNSGFQQSLPGTGVQTLSSPIHASRAIAVVFLV